MPLKQRSMSLTKSRFIRRRTRILSFQMITAKTIQPCFVLTCPEIPDHRKTGSRFMEEQMVAVIRQADR
jgi:hypothetical protein